MKKQTPTVATAKSSKAVIIRRAAKKPAVPVCSKCGRVNKRSANVSPDCHSATACAARQTAAKDAA